MDKNEIFLLWKKVLKGNKEAKKKFVEYYKLKYPGAYYIYDHLSKENLKIMYLHLYK